MRLSSPPRERVGRWSGSLGSGADPRGHTQHGKQTQNSRARSGTRAIRNLQTIEPNPVPPVAPATLDLEPTKLVLAQVPKPGTDPRLWTPTAGKLLSLSSDLGKRLPLAVAQNAEYGTERALQSNKVETTVVGPAIEVGMPVERTSRQKVAQIGLSCVPHGGKIPDAARVVNPLRPYFPTFSVYTVQPGRGDPHRIRHVLLLLAHAKHP